MPQPKNLSQQKIVPRRKNLISLYLLCLFYNYGIVAHADTQDPFGEQNERKKFENSGLDRNSAFCSHVRIIYTSNMGRPSRTQNAVHTAFSRRSQLHYMDGLRTSKRETRLSFVCGKFTWRHLRLDCNNRRVLIKPEEYEAYASRYIM